MLAGKDMCAIFHYFTHHIPHTSYWHHQIQINYMTLACIILSTHHIFPTHHMLCVIFPTHYIIHSSLWHDPLQINHMALACTTFHMHHIAQASHWLYHASHCSHLTFPCIKFPVHHNGMTYYKSITSHLCVILTQTDIGYVM